MNAGIRLAELAELCGAELVGDPDYRVRQVATLERAGPDEISFFSNKRYKDQLRQCQAGAVILAPEFQALRQGPCLVSDQPYVAFAKISQRLNPLPRPAVGVHPTAVVAEDAQVDASASIGPRAVIESQARIGAGAVIGPGSVVGEGAVIGPDSHLHAQVTLPSMPGWRLARVPSSMPAR